MLAHKDDHPVVVADLGHAQLSDVLTRRQLCEDLAKFSAQAIQVLGEILASRAAEHEGARAARCECSVHTQHASRRVDLFGDTDDRDQQRETNGTGYASQEPLGCR